MDYQIPLVADGVYHIFTHAVGTENLFRQQENYRFFLEKYSMHVLPVADTYAYCLLPNHFHLLVKIKQLPQIQELHLLKKKTELTAENESPFIVKQLSNFLNSYAKSYNSMFGRRGALFLDFIRRVEVKSAEQFTNTLHYVHKNPVHHGFCKSVADWKWSSYHSLLSNKPTMLLRQEVIDWFGNVDNFYAFHQQPVDLKHASIIEL